MVQIFDFYGLDSNIKMAIILLIDFIYCMYCYENKVLKTIDYDFPSKEYKTGKEYLDKLNDDLNSAGLQDILDEVNRQLEEYNETHNTDN